MVNKCFEMNIVANSLEYYYKNTEVLS